MFRVGLVFGVGVAAVSIVACSSDTATPATGGDGGLPRADATTNDVAAEVDVSTGDVGSPLADANRTDDANGTGDADEAGDADGAGEASGPGAGDAALESGASCDSGTPSTHVLFKFDATDPEFVTSVTWIDSTGKTTPNWAASGGPRHCTDPQEFFGQSYGAPEGNPPGHVVGGHLASIGPAARCDSSTATITGAATDCTGAAQLPVTTTYVFYGDARANEVQVTRTFGFATADASTPVYSGVGLRPYVPRVPYGTFPTVVYPNMAGTAVASANVASCGNDCLTSQGSAWSGRWFADIAPSGYAIVVLRDASMTSPVDFTVNEDASSGSNLASFVLLQPTGGWQSPITEIEYLCFEDLTTWPQAQRDAAVLPLGCGP